MTKFHNMELKTPSDFTPRMISTPDPRLPSYTGQPMGGMPTSYPYSYQHPMTPITRPESFMWDPHYMRGPSLYNPFGSPMPYPASSLQQESQRFFPLPPSNGMNTHQGSVAPGTISTKSVSFSVPSTGTESPWERQMHNIYQSPLQTQSVSHVSESNIKDGATQTIVPCSSDNSQKNVQPGQLAQVATKPSVTDAGTALDIFFCDIPKTESSTIKGVQTDTMICHSCKKDTVDTPTFNGKEKWDTFISLFEKVAEINNWENAAKCKRLMVALRGNALEFVDTLQLKVTKDFDLLKSALAKRFGVMSNESLYRVKFKGRRRNENETLDRYIQDLQYLAERAYPTEKGTIYHRLIVEQFIEGIGNKECKNYLQLNLNICQETDSGLIQEVLKYAHNYESVMGNSDRIRKPSEETANALKQNANNQPRPLMQNAPYNRGGYPNGNSSWNRRGSSPIICFRCSGEGHIASRCPLNEQKEHQENLNGLH